MEGNQRSCRRLPMNGWMNKGIKKYPQSVSQSVSTATSSIYRSCGTRSRPPPRGARAPPAPILGRRDTPREHRYTPPPLTRAARAARHRRRRRWMENCSGGEDDAQRRWCWVTPTQRRQRQIPCAAASRCAISRNWRRRSSEAPCDWLPSAGGGGGGGGWTGRAEVGGGDDRQNALWPAGVLHELLLLLLCVKMSASVRGEVEPLSALWFR